MSSALTDPPHDVAVSRHAEHPRGILHRHLVCIGCKACEVACKEWNGVPEDGTSTAADVLRQHRRARCQHAGATSRSSSSRDRIDQARHPGGPGRPGHAIGMRQADGEDQATAAGRRRFRWLMASDVCKHCTHAGLPGRLPHRRAVPHRVRHRRGAGRRLQRLRLLRPGLPVRRDRPAARSDGRAPKCTLCYDRLVEGQTPACAQACPTESIQFGDLDELRERAA